MTEEEYDAELARKDALISDLLAEIATMNASLSELLSKQQKQKKEAAPAPTEPTPATPAADSPMSPGALALVRACTRG